MRSLLILLVPLLAAAPALAETCKYVDNEGRIIYSNVPIKNARKIACFQPPAPPPPQPSARPAVPPDAGASRQRTSAGRARHPTQARPRSPSRSSKSELAREQKALDDARKALAEQEALRSGDERNYARVQERLKPFQDTVAAHEKNIASIRQEIANLEVAYPALYLQPRGARYSLAGRSAAGRVCAARVGVPCIATCFWCSANQPARADALVPSTVILQVRDAAVQNDKMNKSGCGGCEVPDAGATSEPGKRFDSPGLDALATAVLYPWR